MISQETYRQRRAALMERFAGSDDVIYLKGNIEAVVGSGYFLAL